MKYLIAIDPGVHASGIASFVNGKLIAATYLKVTTSETSLETSIQMMAEKVGSWGSQEGRPDEVVIELPQVYVRSRSKGDPNDLISLAAACGAMASQFPRVRFVKPSEWKKQTPKEIVEQRAIKKLYPDELTRVVLPSAKSLAHNVWDAVAIGLWVLGTSRDRMIRAAIQEMMKDEDVWTK